MQINYLKRHWRNPFASVGVFLVAVLAAGAAVAAVGTEGGAGKALAEVEHYGGVALQMFEPLVNAGVHGFFELLDKQPIIFLLLALSIGYPLGKVSLKGVSLGSTAGTLLVGLALSITASVGFGIRRCSCR